MPISMGSTTKASPGRTSAKRITRRYARTQPRPKQRKMTDSVSSRPNRWSKALTIGQKKKKKKK